MRLTIAALLAFTVGAISGVGFAEWNRPAKMSELQTKLQDAEWAAADAKRDAQFDRESLDRANKLGGTLLREGSELVDFKESVTRQLRAMGYEINPSGFIRPSRKAGAAPDDAPVTREMIDQEWRARQVEVDEDTGVIRIGR